MVSANGQVDSNGYFGAFVSGGKIRFPGNRDCRSQRLGSNAVPTVQEGRASRAAGTIQLASRQGEQRPCHEEAARRSLL
jgi:hypothetical protein